jgi:hypothetical protein
MTCVRAAAPARRCRELTNVAWKRSGVLVLAAVCSAALLSWGAAVLWLSPTPRGSQPASERQAPSARRAESLPALVTTLYEQATSAYHARLFVDDEGVVLITQSGFTTIRPGAAAEEHALSLGPVAVRQGGAVVFWRSGKLRSVSLSGADERELAVVPLAPQYLLASESNLAWIHTDRQHGTSLQTLSGGQVRLVHAVQDSVSACVLHGGSVYWVSEARGGAWSIGRVDLDGGRARSTPAQRGRPPAMLAAGRDGVYFYGGPQRGVRRLSFDLEQETAVLTQVVCSPLVVSSRVVCAQVGGLFEIAPAVRAPRPLAAERAGPITATAATDARAYWVAESGGERLIVRSVALPEL